MSEVCVVRGNGALRVINSPQFTLWACLIPMYVSDDAGPGSGSAQGLTDNL